jgi:hypothetical protein
MSALVPGWTIGWNDGYVPVLGIVAHIASKHRKCNVHSIPDRLLDVSSNTIDNAISHINTINDGQTSIPDNELFVSKVLHIILHAGIVVVVVVNLIVHGIMHWQHIRVVPRVVH